MANLYKTEIDFVALALQDTEFAKSLKPNGQLDFSNPLAVQQLTKSLLKRDFGLKLTLPPDRLCPPVPNRYNYILWIQSLLDTTDDSYLDVYDPEREVLGLDIGTGSSCIYPLLGCSLRRNWRFAGTDIDEKSLLFSRENVKTNELQNSIKLFLTKSNDPLICLDMLKFENVDFTMCNPPFYESKAEMVKSADVKQRPPFTACTGSESEMVTTGGEVAFVSRMIDDSFMLTHRVQWYTSMLGKFSSIAILVEKLKARKIDNYAITEFVQGSKTRRWAIAWSFDDLRPSMSIARGVSTVQKSLLPFPSEYTLTLSSSLLTTTRGLQAILSQMPLRWFWKASNLTGLGFSDRAVWSRSARRKERMEVGEKSSMEDSDNEVLAFGFKIHVEAVPGGQAGCVVTVRWVKGHDSVIFESFCGVMRSKLTQYTE